MIFVFYSFGLFLLITIIIRESYRILIGIKIPNLIIGFKYTYDFGYLLFIAAGIHNKIKLKANARISKNTLIGIVIGASKNKIGVII